MEYRDGFFFSIFRDFSIIIGAVTRATVGSVTGANGHRNEEVEGRWCSRVRLHKMEMINVYYIII